MFAVVRTGGKQYRVAEGDIIAVEKLTGQTGDSVSLGDVLMAGEGEKLEDTSKLTVSAEIVEQTRGEKVTIFKKRRRQNYRRRNGHRQYMTLLRITGIGDAKKNSAPAAAKKPAAKADDSKADAKTDDTAAQTNQAAAKKPAAKKSPAAKKPAADDKTVAKKAATGKPAANKSPAKGEATKKAPAKKAAAKKTDGANDENGNA